MDNTKYSNSRMNNPSMVHRAETMWCTMYPYRNARKEECPAKVQLILMVNRLINPWNALQDLEKVIPFKRRQKLKELLK